MAWLAPYPIALFAWLVDESDDARTEGLAFSQCQGRFNPVLEETLSNPKINRINQDAIFIDKVVLHQRLYESATTINQDVLTGLLLQPGLDTAS